MTNLQKFGFDGKDIRIQQNEQGEPWFCAKDVCEVLEIENPSDAVKKGLDSDEYRSLDIIYPPHGVRATTFISESGIYALVFKSRKPEAKRFSKWVRSEVLPAIRKTGGYGMAQVVPALPGLPSEAAAPLAALVQALKAQAAVEVEAQARADAAEAEAALAEQMALMAAERKAAADDLRQFGRALMAKADAVEMGGSDDRLPPEWSGIHKKPGSLPMIDVMLGLGFKTDAEARSFMVEVMRWVDVVRHELRDAGSRQMEFYDIPKPSLALVSKGWLVDEGGGQVGVTASGRGAIEAKLGYHRHKYDLRGPIETNRIRGIVCGKLHAGALPELREAFRANRAPQATGFSGPAPKALKAAAPGGQ